MPRFSYFRIFVRTPGFSAASAAVRIKVDSWGNRENRGGLSLYNVFFVYSDFVRHSGMSYFPARVCRGTAETIFRITNFAICRMPRFSYFRIFVRTPGFSLAASAAVRIKVDSWGNRENRGGLSLYNVFFVYSDFVRHSGMSYFPARVCRGTAETIFRITNFAICRMPRFSYFRIFVRTPGFSAASAAVRIKVDSWGNRENRGGLSLYNVFFVYSDFVRHSGMSYFPARVCRGTAETIFRITNFAYVVCRDFRIFVFSYEISVSDLHRSVSN